MNGIGFWPVTLTIALITYYCPILNPKMQHMKNSESKSEYSSYHSYMRTVCGSFQDIAHPDHLSKNLQQPNCTPPTNVVETDRFYLIEMAIPGYHKEELHVRVDEDVLSVDAKPLHRLDCIRLMHREEFGKSAFSCSLLLPENNSSRLIKFPSDFPIFFPLMVIMLLCIQYFTGA